MNERVISIEQLTRGKKGSRSGRMSVNAPPSAPILTEDSAAVRFADLYRDRLRFDHTAGAWFEWDGALWRKNGTGLAFQFARELARELSRTEPDKTRFISSKTSFAAGVERFSRSDPTFAVQADQWDRDPLLLGTPNGTVDLRTGVLRPAVPGDCITKSAAVLPLGKVSCPRWLQFLSEATGSDLGMIRFLQQWCGYALTGDTREHALAFLYGEGGNGKSVFLNVLTGILGSYAVVSAMETFIASHGDRHTTDLAMLAGARLVTASETEEGRAWAEARIKALTGGEPITARFMRQDNFTFRPAFKLTIAGNHKPVLRNVDDAARRRFNLLPFTRKPITPDPQLEVRLKTEWPGILQWMIEGCLDWQRCGLSRPEAVRSATASYFSDQDVFAQWLEEACDAEPGNPHKWEGSSTLFASWSAFAVKSGERPGSAKSLASQLEKHGFEPHRMMFGRGFRGIRVKIAADHSGMTDDGL